MSVEKKIMFIPAHIDLGQSEKYILSIRISNSGLMFSISDPDNGKNYCLRETSFSTDSDLLINVQRIVFDLNFLTQPFKQTNVVFVSSEYDFMPTKYLAAKEKQQLYDLTHVDQSDYMMTGGVIGKEYSAIYSVSEKLHSFLCRNLYDPHFYHHTEVLADMLQDKGKAVSLTSKMFVYFHDNLTDVICFKNSKFIHCLTYENEPDANQLYFILKIWEQCQFDQMKDYLYIIGTPGEYVHTNLYDYIKNIETISTPSEVFLWSEDAQKAPLDLLYLSL